LQCDEQLAICVTKVSDHAESFGMRSSPDASPGEERPATLGTTDAGSDASGVDEPEGGELPASTESTTVPTLTVVSGAEDLGDAYSGIAFIDNHCSGTLVSSGRLVTAAHCYCEGRWHGMSTQRGNTE